MQYTIQTVLMYVVHRSPDLFIIEHLSKAEAHILALWSLNLPFKYIITSLFLYPLLLGAPLSLGALHVRVVCLWANPALSRIQTVTWPIHPIAMATSPYSAPAPEYWNKGGHGHGGAHGDRVEREPVTGVWGQSPQRGPGAEPLVAPWSLKLFSSQTCNGQSKLYPFQYFQQFTIR